MSTKATVVHEPGTDVWEIICGERSFQGNAKAMAALFAMEMDEVARLRKENESLSAKITTYEEMEPAAMAQVRREAMEEAAKRCDRAAKEYEEDPLCLTKLPVTALQCAAADIRALAPPAEPEKPCHDPIHQAMIQTFKDVATPRDWPEDYDDDNGCYQNTCCQCGKIFTGHKRRVVCKKCAEPVCETCGGSKKVDQNKCTLDSTKPWWTPCPDCTGKRGDEK